LRATVAEWTLSRVYPILKPVNHGIEFSRSSNARWEDNGDGAIWFENFESFEHAQVPFFFKSFELVWRGMSLD
jgi:hypothetical protein